MRTVEIGANSPQKSVWWKVDLGGVYNIHSINILFKKYDDLGMFLLCTSVQRLNNFLFKNVLKIRQNKMYFFWGF